MMACSGCVQAYTSLLDACVKAGTPQSLAQAFRVRGWATSVHDACMSLLPGVA